MLKDILLELFARDLGRLEQEIASYPTDESLWLVVEGISNSGGNLTLTRVTQLASDKMV